MRGLADSGVLGLEGRDSPRSAGQRVGLPFRNPVCRERSPPRNYWSCAGLSLLYSRRLIPVTLEGSSVVRFLLADTSGVQPDVSGVKKVEPVAVILYRRIGGRRCFPRYILCPVGLTPWLNFSWGGVSNKRSNAALLTCSRQISAHSALIFACAAACDHALVPLVEHPVRLVVKATAVSSNRLTGVPTESNLPCLCMRRPWSQPGRMV